VVGATCKWACSKGGKWVNKEGDIHPMVFKTYGKTGTKTKTQSGGFPRGAQKYGEGRGGKLSRQVYWGRKKNTTRKRSAQTEQDRKANRVEWNNTGHFSKKNKTRAKKK